MSLGFQIVLQKEEILDKKYKNWKDSSKINHNRSSQLNLINDLSKRSLLLNNQINKICI